MTQWNWQQRASEFKVGDTVVPIGANESLSGRVVALWPAIGMVDVQFPMMSKRLPVEDLQIVIDPTYMAPVHPQIPGGVGTVPVSGGPYAPMTRRVASSFLKKALYWAQRDRKYKATRNEKNLGKYCCPKCGEQYLRRTSYKRNEGKSVRLLACPSCLFLIKEDDILGVPAKVDSGLVFGEE